MKKTTNKSIFGWVFARIKKFIPFILIISILAAIVSLGFLGLALLSKSVLEIATGDREGNILYCGILLLGLVVVQVLCSFTESVLKTAISGRLTVNLRKYLFGQIQQKKYFQIVKYHSGDLLNRLTSDVDVLQSGAINILPNAVSILTKIISSVAALIILEPTVAILILAFGVLVPILARIFSKRFKHLHKEAQQAEGVSRSFIQECFENRSVIKTFKSQNYITNRLNEYLMKNYKLKIKRSVISTFVNIGLYSFFTLGYYAVLFWGAVQIAKPESAFTYGTLIAFLQLVSQLRAPLQNVSGILPQYYSLMASAERLMEIENIDNEKSALENERLQKICDEFEFLSAESISFSYEDGQVFEGRSFKIDRGTMTAILGDSGAGKSTIFKLLLSLYDLESGSITLNGNIPIDPSIRGIFSYVPQGNMIVSGTIRENITMSFPSAEYNIIEKAAEVAEILDFIKTLPHGFDTELSERGAGLSEGQLQRIAIARALVSDAPILLLDEATSALDKATEAKVLKNIKALSDKTVILVTHRTSNLNLCDNIINLTE